MRVLLQNGAIVIGRPLNFKIIGDSHLSLPDATTVPGFCVCALAFGSRKFDREWCSSDLGLCSAFVALHSTRDGNHHLSDASWRSRRFLSRAVIRSRWASGWRLLICLGLHATGMVRSVFGRLAATRNPYGLPSFCLGRGCLDVAARIREQVGALVCMKGGKYPKLRTHWRVCRSCEAGSLA